MRRKVKCFATVVLSALLLMSSLVTSAFAARLPATPSDQLKKPGENGYVSLHKYATPTDIEDVYKVTLTVQGKYELPPVLVTLVLDHSGSMQTYLTGTTTYRYQAVAAGAREALDQLKAANNPNIWVNIVGYGQDSSGSNINNASVSLTDKVNQSALTSTAPWNGNNGAFHRLLDASGNIDQIFYDAIQIYRNWQYWPGYSSGTWIGAGEKQAYDDLVALQSIISGGGLDPNTTNYNDYVNFAMILTDGQDNLGNFVPDTQTWALALKAPTTRQITPTAYGANQSPVSGAGSTVWAVVVAATAPTTWRTDWVTVANGSSAGYSTIWHPMVSVATSINWSGTQTPSNPWQIYSSTQTGDTALRTALSAIVPYAEQSPSGTLVSETPFTVNNSVSEIESVFAAFANAAVSGADSVVVHDVIGSQFSLYQYPGAPLFKTEATGTVPTGMVMPTGGTAGNAGKNITWDIGSIVDGITYTMTYYVKIDSATADPSLWYPTNEYAYITYGMGSETYIVYFPEPLVNVAGEIDSQEPESEPEPETAALPNAIQNVPMYVGAFGTPLQPYTPSVTPTIAPSPSPEVEVEEEFLDDGTVEGYDGVVPWTGQISYTVLFIVLVCLAGGTVLLWRKRLSRR